MFSAGKIITKLSVQMGIGSNVPYVIRGPMKSAVEKILFYVSFVQTNYLPILISGDCCVRIVALLQYKGHRNVGGKSVFDLICFSCEGLMHADY